MFLIPILNDYVALFVGCVEFMKHEKSDFRFVLSCLNHGLHGVEKFGDGEGDTTTNSLKYKYLSQKQINLIVILFVCMIGKVGLGIISES